MYYFVAVLIALLIIAIIYVNVNKKLDKPVGGLLINVSPDGETRVGVALYKGETINDILTRKYVILEVDTHIDMSVLEKYEQ